MREKEKEKMDTDLDLDDALAKFRSELNQITPIYKTGKMSKLLDRIKKVPVYSSLRFFLLQ